MKMVRMAISRPRKNQSEYVDLPYLKFGLSFKNDNANFFFFTLLNFNKHDETQLLAKYLGFKATLNFSKLRLIMFIKM